MTEFLKKYPLLRLVLGAVFVYASLDKIANPLQFADAVSGYRLVPPQLTTIFALILPWLEMVAGVCLVVGFLSHSAASWIALMSASFLVAKASVVARGIDISCGCFETQGGAGISPGSLVLSLLLVGASIWQLRLGPGRWALDDRLFSPE